MMALKKMSLLLAALGLSTGLAFAQQRDDYPHQDPAAPETLPMPSFTHPEEAPPTQDYDPAAPETTPMPSITEETPVPQATGTISQQAANQIRTKELLGAKAVHQDSDVAKVDDLLLAQEEGKVVGVVLSVGGVLGVGSKLVAVYWEAIDLARDESNQLILHIAMSKEQLEAAPYFEPAKHSRQARVN